MELREWLFRKRMSVRDFSKIINYTENYVSGFMNGTRFPGRKFKEAVIKATNSEVTFEEETGRSDKN